MTHRMLTRSAALLLALAVASPSMVLAQESAGAHFERGVEFSEDRDYVAAMVEFKKAYALDPRYPVLFNIGQTANELKDYASALDSYELYLSKGGSDLDAERRTKVEGLITVLKQKVATITLTVDIVGAAVAVDDVEVGVTPLQKPVRMNAGRRRISVTRSGYEPLNRVVEIAGTEEKTLSFELVSLTAEKGGDRATTAAEIEHTPWPWIGLSATLALGVGTGVMGGLTLSKHSDLETALATAPTTKETIDDARSDAKTFALVTDVLLGVTIASAALTGLAFGLDYGRSSTPEEAAPASAVLVVGPGFTGVYGAF